MTKKDYVLIASALNDAHQQAKHPSAGRKCHMAIDCVTVELVHRLEADNPSFNRATFLRAAGYTQYFEDCL